MFKQPGKNVHQTENQTHSLHDLPEEGRDSLFGIPRAYNFPSTMDTQMQTLDKDYQQKESINTVDYGRGSHQVFMSDDEEPAKIRRRERDSEDMELFYTVCVKYSENVMMNQRFLRPTYVERKRNILDKLTLTNILEGEVNI